MTRTSTLGRSGWCAALLFLGSMAGLQAAEPLRVYGNLTTIELAPVLLAAERFHDEPVSFGMGGVPDLFREGGAEVATNAETQALRVSVDNPDLRIVMTVSEGLYRIVARRSSGITKLEDLKGKRISTIGITSSGYFLQRMLETVGLDSRDVTIVPLFPLPRMVEALAKGEIDAATIWEPEMQHALERLGDDAIEFGGKGVYRELFNLNTTRQALADPAQRSRVAALVRSILQATKALHEDPTEAWALVARSSGYDESTVAKVWHHHAYPGALVPDILDVLEAEEVWSARERDRKPRTRAQLATLVDDSVLKEVLAADPSLRVVAPDPAQVHRQANRLRVERLSASVRNAAALRQVKVVQHALSHYREAGLWRDAGELFTRDATARFADGELHGRDEIAAHLAAEAGTARGPLPRGRLNTHLVLSPVVTVNASGERARGRWHEVSMTGVYGESANWAGGIYENEYALEDGFWKISRLHYYPSFLGPYTPGWRNADRSDTVTIVPFHYGPAGAGTPIPAGPKIAMRHQVGGDEAAQKTRVQQLRGELARQRDETLVQNLQNAYGYYFDRRMWDDIADLFAADGTLELGGRGVYAGRGSIRRGLETIGPLNLAEGVLNDHLQLQPVITISADGQTARARGTELSATGQNGGEAWWGVNIYENHYVKTDGVWRLQSVQVFPRLRTDYFQGWAKSALPPVGPSTAIAPDRPSTVRITGFPGSDVPPLHFPSPANTVRTARALPPSQESLDDLLIAAERELDTVVAVEAGENVSNAYGYYIDEFLWDNTADLFSVDGSKELSYIGNYVGRERVRESMVGRYGSNGRRPGFMAIHQKTMPYVTVAPDGRSAKLRARLFQMNSAMDGDGSYISGIYENGIVRERGVWKISSMDLDYAWTANYTGGWARVDPPAQPRQSSPPSTSIAPDGPLRGAIYPPYPGLETMAFHFRNPVSGREPPELLPP